MVWNKINFAQTSWFEEFCRRNEWIGIKYRLNDMKIDLRLFENNNRYSEDSFTYKIAIVFKDRAFI